MTIDTTLLTIISLIIGGIGAFTGIISLIWHMSNSRSKVILDTIHFVKADRHTHKVTIDVEALIKNKSNRATTIETIYFRFGRIMLEIKGRTPVKIEPNSSYKIVFSQSITPEEYKDFVEADKILLGLEIIHTFGRIEKQGYTTFVKSPYFNL